jgi:lipopolysaccharide transport system ATP-binding protein
MLLGFRKEEVEANLDSIIQFSELGDFIDKPVKTYSAGMKARLGFSVALKMSPDVLLIDEVLGVGDIDFREKSMAVMREKLLSNQTIVFVSHMGSIVRELCNRAVWIEDGVARMEGEAAEVVRAYEEYVTKIKGVK